MYIIYECADVIKSRLSPITLLSFIHTQSMPLLPGTRVWAPHPDHKWAAAVIESVDAEGEAWVLFSANDIIVLPVAQLVPIDERDPELAADDGAAAGVSDLIALPALHEASMLNVSTYWLVPPSFRSLFVSLPCRTRTVCAPSHHHTHFSDSRWSIRPAREALGAFQGL